MSKKILCCGCVCYPESVCENFFEKLNSTIDVGYKYILHDKDVDKDGNLKKPHYHILFQSILTATHWKAFYSLANVKHHEDFFSPDGAEKYLSHEDNEDKHHYDKSEVKTSDNWDADIWDDLLEKEKKLKEKSEDADNVLFDIIQAIEEHNIRNIRQLTKWVMSNMDKSAISVVVSKSYFFNTYMKDVD